MPVPPAPVAAASWPLSRSPTSIRCARLADVNAEYKAINAMPDGPDKEAGAQGAERARQQARLRGGPQRAAARHLFARAAAGADGVVLAQPLQRASAKANLRWLVGDYADRAIRPHALGQFRDLVLATLEHPAMLQYLDNNQNAAGHVNENYARELMELHTLGVDGGYTQQDVQQLARMLTGVGINAGDPPKLKPEWQDLYRRDGAFEFNPARHDFGTKVLLGRTIQGRGFAEVEEAVALIVRQPACAHFISRELAIYFVADDPPPALVERMAQTFSAHRRRHRRRAAHDVPLAGAQRRARRQIQGSDALRRLRRALRLRRPHHQQHAAAAQLAERSGRGALRAPDPRRLSADEPAGRAPAR